MEHNEFDMIIIVDCCGMTDRHMVMLWFLDLLIPIRFLLLYVLVHINLNFI